MRRAEFTTAGLLALLSIYLMWKSAELEIGFIPDEGPGGGAWPFWLALVMLICTGFIGFNALRRASPPSRSEEPFLDTYGLKMLALVGGGIIGFVGLTHIISMYGAMAIFLLYYLRFLGRHSWFLTLSMAVLLPCVFFIFFEGLMRITLPKGMPFMNPVFTPLYKLIY
ncbi:MAG: tripartite tricarboxylate transporter TctB family protein [Geminicoccaceae bacterium]